MLCVDWDNVGGTAARFGLDGPGMKYRWGRDFSHPYMLALGPIPAHIRWVLCHSRR